ncbi:Gfo/Idh/MocA family protein [Zhihengliuella salsuginis]|uniref:Oxidoreductase n=1 Tax=Zhihengliuella salsuginis TaxID=578222 RepID=A0ABQ3GFU7_9MICC|nr:Gfo/Idh/MocA family oxidoreductase [Zhihengliuella salsuginis]GHD03169.1 oxidoreductase [Zhihengliuella salsuginis]
MPESTNTGRLRVGLIGHSFMGSIHAAAWRRAPEFFDLAARPELVAVCGRDAGRAGEFAERFGIGRVETDWRRFVESDDVDVIDICVPGDLHAPIAIAALEAGKHVLCEKPLANTPEEAEAMVAAARAAAAHGVRSMVGYSYRGTPAIAYARQLVEAGRLGRIRHIRARYLQDWIVDEDFPLVWRLQRERAGSGALGDIGAHLVDMAAFVTGQRLREVGAMTETFVKQRPLPDASGGLSATAGAGTGEVTVDDAALFMGRTDGGALASFEATRFATGRKNAIQLEVNGAAGSVYFDFENLNELWFHDHTLPAAEAGFRRIHVTEPDHPFAGAWWPPGHGLGYDHVFVHQAVEFARAIASGADPAPSFDDGGYVQRVLAAVEASSADGSRMTPVAGRRP